MRLIDADEIKKREHDVVLANGAKHRCFDTTRLYEIPTVEAEPVIRCKDCKHWQFYDSVKANVCKRRYDRHYWQSHEDDFCSRAEREEE